MGKAKKKKFTAPKPRPTGLPSVGECEQEIELQGFDATSSTLQTIIEKLQSPNEENRECACTTIAGLVSHPGTLTELLKLNVVKILGPLVLDHSWDIRHRALGALRNLSVDGGMEVCEEMVAKDILTPVLALVKQFGGDDQFAVNATERQKLMICETFAHAFYLLQNLCENSSLAVTVVSKEQLVPVICSLLESEHTTVELKLAVFDCLHTVTEDNSTMCSEGLVECVQRVIAQPVGSSLQVLLKTLATGVLVNLQGSALCPASGAVVFPTVTTMCEVLSQNVASILTVQTASSEESSDAQQKDTEKLSPLEKKIADIENILKAQRVALEVIANLCCSDEDDWEEMSSSESSGDDMEVAMEEDCDNTSTTPLSVSTELLAAFVQTGIIEKVLQAAQPLTEEQLQVLQNNKDLQQSFNSKQTHALLCLNNLVSTMDAEALGGPQKLHTIWQGLLQFTTAHSSLEKQDLLEAATSAMRAVIQKLAAAEPAKFSETQQSDLQFMYEMSTKCNWSEVRVNAVRMVSTIGGILAQNPVPHPLLKDIGVMFLEVVSKDSDLWVVAEALDSIFDVFGEDHVNPVLKEIGLVVKLESMLPALKAKVHQNRKCLGEHYPVISTARTNLVRFIKYKSTLMNQ